MRERSRKTNNVNSLAYAMAEAIVAGKLLMSPDGKNPLAVVLGRRGGLKGGPARAAKLSSKQLSDSAKKAAKARWDRAKG